MKRTRIPNFMAALACILVKHLCHEDFNGITRAVVPPSEVQPFRENDLSLFAICRASAEGMPIIINSGGSQGFPVGSTGPT